MRSQFFQFSCVLLAIGALFAWRYLFPFLYLIELRFKLLVLGFKRRNAIKRLNRLLLLNAELKNKAINVGLLSASNSEFRGQSSESREVDHFSKPNVRGQVVPGTEPSRDSNYED